MADFVKTPLGFGPAREALARKVSWPTALGSGDIALKVPSRIRAQAFFSAKVVQADVLQELRHEVDRLTQGDTDLASARARLRTLLEGFGLGWTATGTAADRTQENLTSTHRLDLILRQNTAMVHAVARREVSERPEVLEFLPNYTYRANTARHSVWDGVTLPKTDPFWDTHTPPVDFNCQCHIEDSFEPVTARPQGADDGPGNSSGYEFRSNPRELAKAPSLGAIADAEIRAQFAAEWAKRGVVESDTPRAVADPAALVRAAEQAPGGITLPIREGYKGLAVAELEAIAAKKAAEQAAKLAMETDKGIAQAQAFGATLKARPEKLGGSTGAVMVEDAHGQKWVFKAYGGRKEQAQNEYIANALYAKAGIPVPEMRMAEFGGQVGVASRYMDGVAPVGAAGATAAAKAKELRGGFATDAWLANWDVAGASFDNLLRAGGKGTVYRVDQGGALLFRAQGSPKGEAFGNEVTELQSLRDPAKNAASAKLFAGLTDDEIAKQVRALKRKVKLKDIQAVITAAGLKGQAARQLYNTLRARLNHLETWAEDLKKAKAEPQRPQVARTRAEASERVISTWSKLSSTEQAAMRRYTGSHYRSINDDALAGKPDLKLDEAIAKLPRYEGMLERGVGPAGVYSDAVWARWKSGEYAYWTNKAYTSTTVEPEVAFAQKGFRLLIKNRGIQSGGYIGEKSEHPGEKEYLLGRNAKYRVAGWGENPKGDKRFLLLEEVDDASQIPDRQEPPPRLDYKKEIEKWKQQLAS